MEIIYKVRQTKANEKARDEFFNDFVEEANVDCFNIPGEKYMIVIWTKASVPTKEIEAALDFFGLKALKITSK